MNIGESLFYGEQIYYEKERLLGELNDEVRCLSGDDLLGDLGNLTNCLVEKYSLEVPVLKEDGIFYEQTPAMVNPAISRDNLPFPGGPSLVPGVRVAFHVPFAGNGEVFFLKPSECSSIFPHGDVEYQQLLIYVHQLRFDAQDADRRFKNTLGQVKQYLRCASRDLDQYNNSLRSRVSSLLSTRKEELARNENGMRELGYTLRK